MAVTISLYNQTAQLLASQGVDLANLKYMLLSNSATFDATDTSIDDVAGAAGPQRANEVYGNGWTEGGETLASVAASIVTTNDAKLDAADVSVVASGGSIGPAYAGVIYDATSDAVLAYVDFGAAATAEEGVNFLQAWSTDGIFQVTNAA